MTGGAHGVVARLAFCGVAFCVGAPEVRRHFMRCVGVERGELRLAADLECDEATELAALGVAAAHCAAHCHATDACHRSHVLFAVELVGDGAAHDRVLYGLAPQP